MAVKSGSKKKAGRTRRTAGAEEILHHSEEQFRILAEEAPVLLWVNGLEGGEFVNRAYLEFLGVGGQVDIQHYDWSQYIHPDDREGYLSKYLECFSRQAPFEAQFRFRRYDGEYRWMKSVGRPRFTSAGQFIGYVGSTQDVTEQKIMEDELRKARDTLEDTVEQRTAELRESKANLSRAESIADLGHWDWDLTTNQVKWSDGHFRIFGYPVAHGSETYEMFRSRIHLGDIDRVEGALRRAIETGELYNIDYRIVLPDGTLRYINAEAYSPARDQEGRPVRMFGIVQDITERKRAEEALRVSEEKYRRIVEMANEGIWTIDQDNVTTFVNPRMARMLGYSPEEVVGRMPYDFLDDAYREDVRNHLDNRHRGTRNQYTCKYLRKDGSDLWAIVSGTPLYDGNGEYIGAMAMITDITERKRAEAALLESERRFRGIYEQAPLGIALIDSITGRFLQVNQKYCDIIGYTQDEMLATDFQSITHPDDLQEDIDNMARLLRGEIKYFNMDKRYVRANGSVCWVSLTAVPLWDNNSSYKYHIAMVEDITDRKRAEDALRESRAHLNSVFLAAPTGIGVVVDRVITEANDRLCEMTGYTRDELLGKNARMLYPTDEDYEYVGREKYEEIRQHGTGSVETRWRRKDGRVIDILLSSTPLEPDNLGAGVTFTALDITERKRMEKALHDTLSKAERHAGELDALVASIADAMMVVDKDGNIVYMNTEALRIFGYVPSDYRKPIAERTVQLRARYPDGTPLKTEDMLAYRALHGETVNNIEMVFNRADVSPLWIIASAAPIKDTHGSISGAVITMIDNTKRKQAEEALKVAKAQAELYLDIMGHDINNMHQIAIGYLELVEGIIPDDDPRKELLEKPTEVLQRSAQLIQNVRKLQKLQEGAFQTQDVEVCQLLVDVQREFGSVPNKAITLNMNRCDHCHVRANELLHDVFANLVSNAIKHTGDKADIVVSLDVAESNGNRFCRVSVEDDGPGIPDDFKGNIFNRMLKGTNKAKGMGLGLYLAKSLVDSYGGLVWAEDRIAGDHTKGARFVVMLPTIEKQS